MEFNKELDKKITELATRISKHTSMIDVDDLIQEARVFTMNLKKTRPDVPDLYLFKSIVNHLYFLIRAEGKYKSSLVELYDGEDDIYPDETEVENEEGSLELYQLQDKVRNELNKLSDANPGKMYELFLSGEDIENVGLSLGVSRHTITRNLAIIKDVVENVNRKGEIMK